MSDITTSRTTLLIKLHDHASREVELTSDHFTIGRKSDNDLAIDDSAVSAHHAKVSKIYAVYFLEDLNSTNGTFVNGKRVTRHQLRDTDVVTIGRHRIIFRDGSGEAPAPVTAGTEDFEKTMVLSSPSARSHVATCSAHLRVLSGSTDYPEYRLTKLVTTIGSHKHATVKLTGWFAPSSAATITCRHDQTYWINPTRVGKKILVNGREISGDQELKKRDRIEIAGVVFQFELKTHHQ